tara:strand:- start:4009 stop:4323 length:315 start_codon:yes stop_codon:yes gene_type:complete
MTDYSLSLWSAVFQAVSFLCLMAIPWTDGRTRIAVAIIGTIGIATILAFQIYVAVQQGDMGLGIDLTLMTLVNVVFYVALSWGVERLFRLYLLKRRKGRGEPPL